MRYAQARKITDAYLDAPKRSERHLHVVAGTAVADPEPYVVEDLRTEAPAVEIPDWAEPFADPRWDDALGDSNYEQRDGRKTALITGRPEGKSVPRREASVGKTARMRRHTPTRARLAGRPDRVALWAVALGLVMAAMAGFTGSGHGHASHGAAPAAPAPVFDR